MLPSTCIVVPTYWTRDSGVERPNDAVYDHPTPVSGTSTLEPLLQSLERFDTERFYLLVLVAVTGEDVADAAEERVSKLVSGHPTLTSLVFGPSHLHRLRSWLEGRALEDAVPFLDLRTYARVRNLQLAIPYALHSQSIVALDDDEIVTDPSFLDKAVEPLGQQRGGTRIDGLSGYYEQRTGGILLQIDPAKATSANVFDRKAAIMNAATEMLERQHGDIVETPFCFGGNMEFTAELAASVGFDPGITRGEDIDYLINARMQGMHIFLRKDLRILHCPPEGGSYKDTSRSKLQQDIVRFIYEQEKLRASRDIPDLVPIAPDDLYPYPGEFLDRDLEEDAVEVLSAAGETEPYGFVERARMESRRKVVAYLDFRIKWPVILDEMYRNAYIREWLMGMVQGT